MKLNLTPAFGVREGTLIQNGNILGELPLSCSVLMQEQLFCTSVKNTHTAAVFRNHLQDARLQRT